MQNPITQLKQHKTAQNEAKSTVKTQTYTNAPKAKQAENAIKSEKTKLTFQPFAQVGYIFQQAKWNAANCKLNHPDCFHLKKLMQQGASRICKNLAITDRLLEELAESLVMTEEQKTTMKQARNTARYLRKQFKDLADYVEQVEQAEGEELDALCYRKG